MRAGRLTLALCLALLCAPAAGEAHGIIERQGDAYVFTAPDPGVGARLTITSPARAQIEFFDPVSPGGIAWGPCIPLSEQRARCSTRGISRVEIEVYDGADSVSSSAAVPLVVSAGPGADTVTGGFGPDQLDGDGDRDTLTGGFGADVINGGEGDDELLLREGKRDQASCGGGTDSARLDDLDVLALPAECEAADRATAPADRTAPRLFLRVPTRMRATVRGLPVGVALNEPGAVGLRGSLLIDGETRGRLRRRVARPDAPRQWWGLRMGMSGAAVTRARRALARGRAVVVLLRVFATDGKGNSTGVLRRIRVRR